MLEIIGWLQFNVISMAISKKQVDVLRKITVAEQLAGRLGTEQVAIFPWDQHLEPTYRVLLDVLAMGGEPGGEAKLAVRWSLVDPQGKMAPVIRRSDLSEHPADVGFDAWVNAQQRNISRLSEEIAAAIREAVGP